MPKGGAEPGWHNSFATCSPVTSALSLLLRLPRRDAEVLSLFGTIISRLGERMEAEVPRIFEAVFEVTLQMITRNFEVRTGGFV